MKISEWLKKAEAELKEAAIGSARLDALILLEDELQKDRAYLLAHPEIELTPKQIKSLASKLGRRIKHEPLAYVRGFSEFYGRPFIVNKTVLEPRPESETMIELLKQLVDNRKLKFDSSMTIVDVGTGSGALAITAKLELPKVQVMATDIDEKCLGIARNNAKKHKAAIKFFWADLLQPYSRQRPITCNLVLANLPYIPNHYKINQAAAMEPRAAIFGGADGLDLYRRLFGQLNSPTPKPAYVLTESLPPQHSRLAKIAAQAGYKLIVSSDFVQLFRH